MHLGDMHIQYAHISEMHALVAGERIFARVAHLGDMCLLGEGILEEEGEQADKQYDGRDDSQRTIG